MGLIGRCKMIMQTNLPIALLDRLVQSPYIVRNLSNGFVKVSGVFARTGVQAYLGKEIPNWDGDPDELIGVYRDSAVLDKLSEGLLGAGLILRHGKLSVSNSYEIMGIVTRTEIAEYSGESFIVGDALFWHPNAVDEINAQLAEEGSVKLPVSPSYFPDYEFVSGTWSDSLGLLAEVNDQVEYKVIQKPPISGGKIVVNHLAVVDFGRGGDIATLYATEERLDDSLTLDSLYGYPQVTLNPKRKNSKKKKKMTKPSEDTKVADNAVTDSPAAAYDDSAVLDALKGVADGQASIADAMTKMADSMSKMSEDSMKYKESNDAILNQLGDLSAIINRAYEREEGDAHRQSAEGTMNGTQAAGESQNFIFDSLKTLAEGSKALQDSVQALIDSKSKAADDSLASVSQSQASQDGAPAASNDSMVQVQDNGDMIVG